MSKYKVLIPIDGSEFARQIFPVIARHFPPEQYELILLQAGVHPQGHVGRPGRPASVEVKVEMYESRTDAVEAIHPIYASQEYESELAEFEREIQHDLRRLREAGYSVTSAIRFGPPGEAIVSYINNNDIDLIAMTTHSRRGLNRLIFGSVCQYVAQHVHIPIIMLRPDAV